MPDKLYNFLKWFCLIAIPSFVTFLAFVLPLWGIADATTNVVVGTMSAVGVLIGSLIGVSTVKYNKAKEEE